QPNLAVWYARLDVELAMQRWGVNADKKLVNRVGRNVARAQTKDQLKARKKLTRVVDGKFRFVSDPPLLVPIDELMEGDERQDIEGLVNEALRGYRKTLSNDLRRLLDRYRLVDIARKVVGVGSVGTRAWVTLSVGRDTDDTLILQLKEAEASVLERFIGKSPYRNHGQRVVEGQRLQQAATDIFLGWQRVQDGIDGQRHDYYVRQLWDWKFSPNVDTMDPVLMASFAEMCGWTLARAHARSGDAIAIGAYLGSTDVFDRALVDFAHAYADQNEVDHQALVDAIAAGKVKAETGV
ncbi:MAG: DUF2252 family protein, partial [Acidimicrobiaceae bacterium]|nr:DUF2252 family protein [Acidimicrobiaceae bacterium]